MYLEKRRRLPIWVYILAAGIILVLIAFLIINRSRPEVTAVSPEAGMTGIPVQTPVEITFSRPMKQERLPEAVTVIPETVGTFQWNGSSVRFTPDSAWSGGTQITITVNTDARSSSGLPLKSAFTWSFRTAPTLLAYLWPLDGPANLYMVDPTFGESYQLTDLPSGVLDFSISPDGAVIYLSARSSENARDSQLMLLDRVNGRLRTLLVCESALCQRVQPSPDGEYLAYENSTKAEVWLLPMENQIPIKIGGSQHPLWSSQGILSVYDARQGAYLFYDPYSGDSLQFPNETGEPGSWSPDGRYFIVSEIVTTIASQLIQFDLQTQKTRNLTPNTNDERLAPQYSPDGGSIVFAHKYLDPERWTRGRQIWVMQANGSQEEPLTDDPLYLHTSFAWHPDGGQLAYLRFNEATLNESIEIWVMDLDSRQAERILIGGFQPVWIP